MSKKWQSLLFDTSEAGVSSAVAPELLPPNQNAWMLNGQNRGGKPSTRPNIKWVLDLPDGLMQGCEFFGVQGGMLVASIDGRMYRIRIAGSTFSYEEITLSFVNSPVIKQVWMTQTVETLVIQDGQSNAILYDGSTAVRAVSGEVPRGRQMAYGNGRLWVAVNANEVVAGDIRTGTPGSELLFTEATYLTGGGKLFFPSDITGMAFIPVTGQSDYGALLVFSADETNAIRADITSRNDWGKIPGFVTGILRSVGAISQWSVASVNQDLYWRDSNRGIRSIRNALADEAGPGSSPLSREVSRLTDFDSQRQLAFCSSIYHDNRLLMTSSPFLLPNGGVGFKSLIALDFAPLSTMGGKTQAAYDGQWTGLTFTKLVAGKFRGRNRGFVISTDENGRNQLWELGTGERDDLGSICVDGTADVEPERIKCFVEYPQRDFGVPKIRKRLERCDVWLSEVNGEVDIQVYWRPDNSQKWLLWDEADTCAQTSDPSTDAPHVWKNLRAQYRPQFKTFTIPDNIEEVVKYSAQVGFEFQIRLVWTGRCKIDRVMVHGTVLDDPDYADRAGFSETCVENDVSGNQITYTLPSAGCSICPEITAQPENESVGDGDSASFSVDSDGSGLSYQWQISTNAGVDWSDIADSGIYSGATTSTLSISEADELMDGYLYRVIISREGCLDVTSGTAELSVAPPPATSLSCESESGTATLIGISEYASPSVPPRKYRIQTLAGGGLDCRGFRGASCSLNPTVSDFRQLTGTYEYPADGSAPINTQVEVTYSEGFPVNIPCGAQTTVIAINSKGEGILPSSVFPFSGGVSNLITQTFYSSTADGICGSPAPNCKQSGTCSKTLSDEDTEDDAILRASKTPGVSCTAFKETRGAGDFSFSFRDVALDFNCSGLIVGRQYVISYDLTTEDYGGGSPVVTTETINFTAASTSEVVGDAIICPSGKQVTASNPSIILVNV